VWLLALETAVVVGATGFMVYGDLTGAAGNQGLAMFMTWYAAGYAAGFGLATYGLYRRSRWARTPALVLNLFLVPVGFFMTEAGLWWLGVPVIGYSLLVGYLLVAAPTREALGIH
jgi:hypothetical protein